MMDCHPFDKKTEMDLALLEMSQDHLEELYVRVSRDLHFNTPERDSGYYLVDLDGYCFHCENRTEQLWLSVRIRWAQKRRGLPIRDLYSYTKGDLRKNKSTQHLKEEIE